MAEKPKHNFFWPNVETLEGASWAVRQAFWATIFCACVTALFATLGAANVGWATSRGASASAFFDVAIFVAIAVGLHRRSRAAAWIGLAFYLVEKIFMAFTNPKLANPGFLGVVIVLAYVGGVRGAQALHRLKTQAPPPAVPLQDRRAA